MPLQDVELNQSGPGCPANRRRRKLIAFAGCTVPAVAHRKGKGTANSGMVGRTKEAISASRYINELARLLRDAD
jgi:hypothetical protein